MKNILNLIFKATNWEYFLKKCIKYLCIYLWLCWVLVVAYRIFMPQLSSHATTKDQKCGFYSCHVQGSSSLSKGPLHRSQNFTHWTTREVLRILFNTLWLTILKSETSLVVQWLRLCASTAGGIGSIPGWGTKIWHAVQSGQKEKEKKRKITPKIKHSSLFSVKTSSIPSALQGTSKSFKS